MFRHRALLTIVWLVILNLGWFSSIGFAQGDFSIYLSSGVAADPGQVGVPLYMVLTSADTIAGIDMLVEFDFNLLTCNSVEWLSHFEHVSYDKSVPGRIRVVGRGYNPDSTYPSPLTPATDTLGIIWMNVTSQNLLADMEVPVSFFEDLGTPFADNRLVRSDSSLIIPPELVLTDGGILIRHPLYGDVNDDGYAYTIADVIFFFNFLAGSQKISSRQRANSDLNGDGVQASMVDFIELLKVIVEE